MNTISVHGVSKRFRRTTTGGPRTLRDIGLHKRVEHWALRDVSFDVRAGESVGLIGLNGSGKSTLLRVIAGTTQATTGTVRTKGVIGGLLALGSGLDPSLSAEENAVTGAILAGIPRRLVPELLPKIAAFAELEDVFHEPMRTFSDGMKLRLAFSTSIHVNPQILLIDEVLAVGDARFREKCIDRLRLMRRDGMTFVIVSHSLSQIEELCDRVVWLDQGVVRFAGPTSEVLQRYEDSNVPEAIERELSSGHRRFGTGRSVKLDGIAVVRSTTDDPVSLLRSGQPITVVVRLSRSVGAALREARVCISIHRASDYSRPVDLSSLITLTGGPLEVRLDLDRLDLAQGEYWLSAGAFTADYSECFDYAWQAVQLTIDGPEAAGPVVPPLKWSVHEDAELRTRQPSIVAALETKHTER